MGCTNAVVEIENTAAIATCHRRCCCCCLLLSIAASVIVVAATRIDKFTLYTPPNENSTRDASQMTKISNEYVFIYRRNVYENSTLTNLWRKKTLKRIFLASIWCAIELVFGVILARRWCGSQTEFTCFPVNDAERSTKLRVKRRAKPFCECKSIFGFSETFINQIEMHFIGCIWIIRIDSIVLTSSTVHEPVVQNHPNRKTNEKDKNKIEIVWREIQYIDIENHRKSDRFRRATQSWRSFLHHRIYNLFHGGFSSLFEYTRPSIHSAFPLSLSTIPRKYVRQE